MHPLQALRLKIHADAGDKAEMLDLGRNPLIKGLSTNLSLMRRAGITDYQRFAREILEKVANKPLSLDVFADDFTEMRKQALRMRDWQENVYVKIPICNPRGETSINLIRGLAQDGVKLHVTAVTAERHIADVAAALDAWVPSITSISAGQIADTARDPMPVMRWAVNLLRRLPTAEVLWAGVHSVLNLFQAEECGVHIAAAPHDILRRAIGSSGRDLEQVSLEAVQAMASEAGATGYAMSMNTTHISAAPARGNAQYRSAA